jgi:branched-chain amino acid transport system substrate-binding protein
MKRTWTAGAAVVVALLGAACGDTSGASASVTIAVEGPLTGEQAAYGTDMLNAVQLAADEVNEAGGVQGRTINVIGVDDQADAQLGIDAARRAAEEGAFAVVGPYNSSVGVANLPIYVDSEVIPLHLTSNVGTNGFGFTVTPKDYQIGPTEAEAIAGFFGAERVAIIYDTSTYTVGIATGVRDALESAGVAVVAFEGISAGESDYSSILAGAGQENPDLWYASTYYPEAGLLAKQAAELGLEGQCLIGLSAQDPQFVDIAGLEVARSCYASGVPTADQFPRAADYLEAYENEFDNPPGAWGSFAYDSARLLFDAVERADGWDHDAVVTALAETDSYEGITGDITIDPATGNRVEVPVVVLDINEAGDFVINQDWAEFAGFEG